MEITINAGRWNFYRLLPLAVIFFGPLNRSADAAISYLMPSSYQPIAPVTTTKTSAEIGDSIAGHLVTSDYGPRKSPCPGCSTHHVGVDLGTPLGTPLKAPKDISVYCWWDANGGGNVASVTPAGSGDTIKMLHLSKCESGAYAKGDTFALTGATGRGTGAHLDIRWADKREPVIEDIEPYLTGEPILPSASSGLEISDKLLTCAIGNAEGTVGDDCQPNHNYDGHTDPGNGAANLGSFSYQHGAESPEQADRKQLARLRNAEREIQAQAMGKWGEELSPAALVSALDLFNQSPKAAQDFVKHLPSADPTDQEIVDARAKSFIDPQTGAIDAPGLGGTWQGVKTDQQRRTDEISNTLEGLQ